MKKHLLSLSAAFALCITGLQAQILNAGFEQARPNGGPANWGKTITQPAPCNVALGYDSVYFLSTDAYTGNYALEMRNAVCDNSTFFAGGAILMENDTNYFSLGVSYVERPQFISLNYKFLPVGGDIANINIQLLDEPNGVTVAYDDFTITQPMAQYSALTIPITYFDPATPTRLIIIFSIENTTDNVNYGTRFLVDDISTLATDIKDIKASKSALVVYPNPSRGPIAIRTAENGPVQLTISNAIGQVVMDAKVATNCLIDMPELSAGLYSYRVVSNNAILGTGKLIKE